MNQHKTKVITSKDQVPEGFINIQEWNDHPRKRKLSEAHIQGCIRACKLMRTITDIRGPVFLHKGDADQYLADIEPQKSTLNREHKNADQSLILQELRRIADVQEQALGILHKLV